MSCAGQPATTEFLPSKRGLRGRDNLAHLLGGCEQRGVAQRRPSTHGLGSKLHIFHALRKLRQPRVRHVRSVHPHAAVDRLDVGTGWNAVDALGGARPERMPQEREDTTQHQNTRTHAATHPRGVSFSVALAQPTHAMRATMSSVFMMASENQHKQEGAVNLGVAAWLLDPG